MEPPEADGPRTLDEALDDALPRIFSPPFLEAWARSVKRQARGEWAKTWGAFWISLAALAIAAVSLAVTLTR